MAAAVAAILPFGIPLVFGPEFGDAIWVAEVLLVGSLLIGARDVLSGGANALGDPWLSSKAQLCAFVATVVLLCALLPRFGILGAAVSSSAAYAIQLGIIVRGLHVSHAIRSISLFHIERNDIKSAVQIFSGLKKPFEGSGIQTEAK